MNKLLLPAGYQDIPSLQARLSQEPEESWHKRGQDRALELFQAMASRVPAYQDFLKARNFSPSQVRDIGDFYTIPVVDKDNYLRKYPYEMLCWDGEFAQKRWVISTTSGSTGQPFYFPRQASQDWQYAMMAELYLRSNFSIHSRSTLYIVAFPMGAWIGGLFTYEALKIVADHGDYSLSIITPGIHKQEVINAVKQLGHQFDQVIIGAYAPFLKDILDDGVRQGIEWADYHLGVVFSAEAFSENFRDYVIGMTGSREPLKATLNHYGTVDLGTMAHETPESILIRRTLLQSNQLDALFPEKTQQPTLAQYNPELFYFEAEDHNLLCSAYSGLPLVRYNLKDYGGILPRGELQDRLSRAGVDTPTLAQEQGISDTLWNLPFVYIYERNDFSVSYYAFLVYPDTIRRALEDSELAQIVTGKFTMLVEYDDTGRQRLHINIEGKSGISPSDDTAQHLQEILHTSLQAESSEYRETAKTVGEVVKPLVKLWEYEDPTYFKPGTKQKWVKK